MRIPFQAIHVSWAHAFPVFSDIPDIHLLRTFFATGRVHAFAVRMETCCRASVALGEPYPPPYSASGLLDVLVTACNSGLYMAVPLALYPDRQSWLNGTNTPYYPFKYSAIDYAALVNFVADESSSPTLETAQQTSDEQTYVTNHCRVNFDQKPSARQTNQSQMNKPVRGGGGSTRRPFVWHPRNSGRGGMNQKVSAVSQKENQRFDTRSGKSTLEPAHDVAAANTEVTNESEPKRKPLGVRNARGSGAGAYRGSSNRGRGGFTQPRPRD